MSDDSLRVLERAARMDGLSERIKYANALSQIGEYEETRAVCQPLLGELQQKDELHPIVRELWINSGGPWLDSVKHGRRKFTRFYNVHVRGKGDAEPTLWTIDWAITPFKYQGQTTFTQDELKDLPKGNARAPSARQYWKSLVLIDEVNRLGLQPEQAGNATRLFRRIGNEWPALSTRIDYQGKDTKIIQDYGTQDEEAVPANITGTGGYLAEISNGELLAKTVLEAASIDEVTQVSERLLQTTGRPYAWRENNSYKGARAVVLGRSSNSDRFNINCNDYFNNSRPARLVVASRAKKFST